MEEFISYNNEKLDIILKDFNSSVEYFNNFDLGYRISKLLNKNLDIFHYSNKKRSYLFFIDKTWVENHISVYKAYDKEDKTSWIIVEYIIWDKRDIMFFSEWKIYNIVENKWGWIVKSSVIEDSKSISNIVWFISLDISYLLNKTNKYKKHLRERWILTKYVSESKIEKFRLDFRTNVLQLA